MSLSESHKEEEGPCSNEEGDPCVNEEGNDHPSPRGGNENANNNSPVSSPSGASVLLPSTYTIKATTSTTAEEDTRPTSNLEEDLRAPGKATSNPEQTVVKEMEEGSEEETVIKENGSVVLANGRAVAACSEEGSVPSMLNVTFDL